MEDPIPRAVLGASGPTSRPLATAGATFGLRRALWLIPAEAAGYGIAIRTLDLALAAAPLLVGPLLR